MSDIKIQLASLLETAFHHARFEVSVTSEHIEIPKERQLGDFACSLPLKLAKQFHLPPIEIAQKIIEHLPKNTLIESIEIAGPGFLNINITPSIVFESLMTRKEKGVDQLFEQKTETVVVEYPSTNVAKPLAVHHLLSTIIGQSLYNITKKLGYQVVSINHIGDWGTQFGKVIFAYKNFDHTIQLEHATVYDLLDLYVQFGQQKADHPEYEDAARLEFLKIEQKDPENIHLWQKFVEISMHNVEYVFKKLGGIHIDFTMGESFYSDKMQSVIDQGIQKEVFIEDSGALICNLETQKLPNALIKKSDGATLYLTRDLATVMYRLQRWNPKKVIYVVDVAQTLHFDQVFAICTLLGVDTSILHHVVFGRMSFRDGRKMSTRSGEVILLETVIEEAEERAEEILHALQHDIPADQLIYLKHICGTGALKYNILSQNPQKNFLFDWDSMLSLQGNSAPYLQYTHARAKSILRKFPPEAKSIYPENIHTKERFLLLKLYEYPEILERIFREHKPNILCTYLFELTQDFNSFYDACSIANAENKDIKNFRLFLTELFAITLRDGLLLLGIEAPEVM